MDRYASIFVERPNHDYQVEWVGIPKELRGTIAFYTDVFCLIGYSVLGMTPELLNNYRNILENSLRENKIPKLRREALSLIQEMNNDHRKQAVLARYPFTGFPDTPRNTFESVGATLNITTSGAETVVKKGIQDLRVMSDVKPIGGIFTVPGFSKLNPTASKRILS